MNAKVEGPAARMITSASSAEKSADTGKTALNSVAAVLDSSGDMVKRENRQNTPRDQQRLYYGHWKQEEV